MEELYFNHRCTVLRFLERRCSDRFLAEDLTAETFLQAAAALERGEPVGCGWLITVSKRRLIDHWRKSGYRSRVVHDERQRVRAGIIYEWEPVDILGPAFRRLPPKAALVLWLRYFLEYSVSDVAAELGISYKAAESLLGRSRSLLASELGGRA